MLKKITVPELVLPPEKPKMQRQTNTVEFSVDDPVEATGHSEDKSTVPKTRVGTRTNLKKLKGFNEKRKQMKYKKFQTEYITNLKTELDAIDDTEDRKYDAETILFIMQAVEDEFIQEGKMGEMKYETVMQLALPYFNNDEQLVDTFIKLKYPELKQSTFLRRMRLKAVAIFLALTGLGYSIAWITQSTR